jgi:hypothetical protein
MFILLLLQMDTHSAPVVNIDGSKIYMTLPPMPPFKSKWAGGSDKSKSFPAKPTVTADEVRISCRKLLATALRGQFFSNLHNKFRRGRRHF